MANEKKGMDPKVAAAIGAAAGLAVGVAAGALTDPKKREKLGKVAKEVKKKAGEALKKIEKGVSEAKDDVIDKLKDVKK